MRRLKRWQKMVVVLVLLLVLPTVVGWVVLDRMASAAVRREVRKLEAAGESVRMEDLLPPPVPEEEDAAPLYERAFTLLDLACSDLESRLVDRSDAFSSDEPWTEEERTEMSGYGGHNLPVEEITKAAAWRHARNRLARNEEALGLLRQAAARDGCRFEMTYPPAVYHWPPALRKIRSSARLLLLSARVRLRDGNVNDAYDDVFAILRLIRATRQPFVTSHYEANILIAITAHGLELVSRADAEHPSQWRRFLNELNRLDHHGHLLLALKGERAIGVRIFEEYGFDRGVEQALDEETPPPRAGLLDALRRPLTKFDEAQYLRCMAEVIETASWGPDEAFARRWDLTKKAIDLSGWARGARNMGYAAASALTSGTRSDVNLQLARTAMILKLWRRQHGAYPEFLEELVPGVLKTVPPDIYSGQSLVYRRVGDGFLLYSVGRDEEDNDGNETPPRPGYGSEGVDIAWTAEK